MSVIELQISAVYGSYEKSTEENICIIFNKVIGKNGKTTSKMFFFSLLIVSPFSKEINNVSDDICYKIVTIPQNNSEMHVIEFYFKEIIM